MRFHADTLAYQKLALHKLLLEFLHLLQIWLVQKSAYIMHTISYLQVRSVESCTFLLVGESGPPPHDTLLHLGGQLLYSPESDLHACGHWERGPRRCERKLCRMFNGNFHDIIWYLTCDVH